MEHRQPRCQGTDEVEDPNPAEAASGSEPELVARVRLKYERLRPLMTERLRRHWAACEALALGRGGIAVVAAATGMSRTTVWTGMKEVRQHSAHPEEGPAAERIRKPGAGRPRLTERDPSLVHDLQALFEPATRGAAVTPLRWTCQSTRQLATRLQHQGHRVCDRTIATLLHELDYRLQAGRSSRDEGRPVDRQAQFEHLLARATAFQRRLQPVLAVDIRKREGLETSKHADPAHESEVGCQCAGHGLARKEAWISVGIDRDTALLTTETIRRWWREMGSLAYPQARELLVAADGGNRNKSRSWGWQLAVQNLADDLGLSISVCHWPAATSKWTTIQQRLTCHLTQQWPGKLLHNWALRVDLIGAATAGEKLTGESAWTCQGRQTRPRIAEANLAAVNLRREAFHGEWNYTIVPRR